MHTYSYLIGPPESSRIGRKTFTVLVDGLELNCLNRTSEPNEGATEHNNGVK